MNPCEDICAFTVWGNNIIVLTYGTFISFSFNSAEGLFSIIKKAIKIDNSRNPGPKYFFIFISVLLRFNLTAHC